MMRPMRWFRPATLDEFFDRSWPRVIAHRGFSGGAPENTSIAVERAIDARADMVEIDILLSRDGEAMVIHDESLDRTTDGSGLVADLGLEALRRLDAGSWFDPAFAREPIPTLDEMLDVSRGRVLVNVEIKADLPAAIISALVADRIRRRDMVDQVIVSSFDPRVLHQLRRVAPEIRRASLYARQLHRGLLPRQVTAQVQACAFHASSAHLDDQMLEDAASAGLPVAVYTVNSKRRMRQWIDRGVSAVFTDRPDLMVELVRS